MYAAGDSVRTTKQLFFVDAHNYDTGESYETQLPYWHRLTVVGSNSEDGTVVVQLPDGFVAELDADDVEG